MAEETIQMKFHSLYWDNINPIIVENHKKVMQKFGIDCVYHNENIDHGGWIDSVLRESKDELVGIIDIDCVPISGRYANMIEYALTNRSMAGLAQVSNHYPPACNIYAAPAFMVLHRDVYQHVDKWSFRANHQERCDVAEFFCYNLSLMGKHYKAAYPKYVHYFKWNLSNYGRYGIGTLYDHDIFHLFESRMQSNIDLFEKVCKEILHGPIYSYEQLPINLKDATY